MRIYRIWEKNIGLNFLSQYRLCISVRCHVVKKFFKTLKQKLWKCYHVTYFKFFTSDWFLQIHNLLDSSTRREKTKIHSSPLKKRGDQNMMSIWHGDQILNSQVKDSHQQSLGFFTDVFSPFSSREDELGNQIIKNSKLTCTTLVQ